MACNRSRICLLFVCAVSAASCASTEAQQPGLKAFVGARIIDGVSETPIENGVLIVRDGKIEGAGPADNVTVPANAERIDLSGKTIVPGFINAHGHVGATRGMQSNAYSRENVLDHLGLYARYGVTTVVSLGGDGEEAIEIRNAQDSPSLRHARLYVAGPVLNPGTPQDAAEQVDNLAAMEVDWVKIRVDDNLGAGTKMPEPVYQAVIENAHRNNLRVAAHMFYLDDAKSLMRAGVDLLAHSVRDTDVDDELIAMMRSRNVCLSPTLTREISTFVYESTPEFFADPFFLREADPSVIDALNEPQRQQAMANSRSAQAYKQALVVASRNLKLLADAGVRIAMGTDTGPVARFQGYFEHLELELMAEAGLTPMQVLMSATRDAAECMGLSDVGALQPGRWADFVVLGANPLTDIKNTRTLESVWIAGETVPSTVLSSE